MRNTSVNELVQSPARELDEIKKSIFQDLHTALPGIVVAYDKDTQTATIQLAIRSMRNGQGIDPPVLTDVPVFFPGGAASGITFPIQKGDECLVVFAEACIDAWYQTGRVGNAISVRRHDYSDGFAFVGFRSYANRLRDVPDTPSFFGNPITPDNEEE